ncbi:MAG: rod shape-determining protein MreC [candidate division Zixibacteria bacterium]|nr:rod shape-determining protein MreC [candidate division Zixibacteria bacterium]
MSRFLTSFFHTKQVVALVLAVGISAGLLSLSQQEQIAINRTVMMTVLTPLQQLFSFLPVSVDLLHENESLRETVLQLKMENTALQESHFENDRLRRLLGFKKRPGFSYIPAEVIAHDPGRGQRSVVIDAGTRAGVRRYMAVVTTDGLLGRVIEAGPVSSIVQLVIDPACKISGLVQRSRSQGSVSCIPELGLLVHLPVRSEIRIGDHIVTSGLGGTFPPGLLIGQVDRLELEDLGLFKRAFVRPQVDMSRLEEVYIISVKPEGDFSGYHLSDRTSRAETGKQPDRSPYARQ